MDNFTKFDIIFKDQRENMEVRIGIKTEGEPRFKTENGLTFLENMLIGDSFHWQRVISSILPGKVELFKSEISQSSSSFSSDHISLINTLPLETYLECVVGSEMNPEAPIEFLKAHAVISRNWAFGKIKSCHHAGKDGFVNNSSTLIGWDDSSDHRGFHVCSDDHCQRYQGLQQISISAKEAIKSTAGQFLADKNGEIIDTRFSKCCGGKTELFSTCWQNINPPGIQSFPDPWCDLSFLNSEERKNVLFSVLKKYDTETQNYGFRWTSEVSKEKIRQNLKKYFDRDIGEIKSVEILHRGPSGRADIILLNGTISNLKLGKELWIRRLLSDSHLYSSAFEISDHDSYISLQGKGWGHGVGLCQIGAARMALDGHSYTSILSFYYPDSQLISLLHPQFLNPS